MTTRIFLAIFAASALSSCGPREGVASGDGPAQPGLYAYTMPNGVAGTLVLHDDGAYAQMADNQPQPIEEGRWRRQDGQFCLDSSGETPTACFAEAAVEGGGFSLTVADAPPIVFTPRG